MLTLEEAIATALKQNFDIQLSKNDSAVAALNYSYRNAAFLPRLNANVGTTWNNNMQTQEFSNNTKREGKVKTNNLELGGSIDVKSEPDQGTEVTLLLPLFETHSESDLQMLGAS